MFTIKNTIESYLQQLETYAKKYLANSKYASSELWPSQYSDVTPYLAHLILVRIEKIQHHLSNNTNNILGEISPKLLQNILLDVKNLLNIVSDALEKGPEVIQLRPQPMQNYYYSISPSAQETAKGMKLSMRSFIEEYDDLSKFCHACHTFQLSLENVPAINNRFEDWEILMLKIRHNQYKEHTSELNEYTKGSLGIDPDTIKQYFSALRENRFVKKVILDLIDEKIVASAIKEVLACERLKAIELRYNTPEVEQLKTSHIQDLTLKDDSFTDDIVIKLAVNPNLVRIQVESNNITAAGLVALCQNPSIREVIITSSAITDEGLISAANALQKSGITKLTLKSNRISEKGLQVLAEGQFRELFVRSDNLPENAKELFTANNTLARLELWGAQLKRQGLQYFAGALAKSHPNRQCVKEYLLAMREYYFLEAARDSLYVKLVLSEPELCERLNNASSKDPKKQTYQRSCAAYSIMLLLNKLGLIPDTEVNRKKELEIYSEIWIESGESADLSLILDYLARYQLASQVLEDSSQTSQLLDNPKVKEIYTKTFENPQIATKKSQQQIFDLFQTNNEKDTYFLLITMPGSNSDLRDIGHIVLLSRENGRYCIYNPGSGYNDFMDTLEDLSIELENLNYSGIAIEVQAPSNNLLKAPRREGFFPTSPKKEETEKESACVLQ